MGEPIRTPACPRCGGDPIFNFLTPYFCGNPDCDVVSWDPTQTARELADPAAWHRITIEARPTGNSEEA